MKQLHIDKMSKEEIRAEFKKLYLTDDVIEDIISRMEENVQLIKQPTMVNLADYSFKISFSETSNGFGLSTIELL